MNTKPSPPDQWGADDAVLSEEASPNLNSVKISHFEGSKLYQRGPLR